MAPLGIVCRYQERMVPTVGGLLLLGRDRLSKFPDAYIQAGRFAGTDRTNFVDRSDFAAYPVTTHLAAYITTTIKTSYLQAYEPVSTAKG